MNAKYLGKKVNRNEFGDIISTFSPAVIVTMKEYEKPRFERIMNWIKEYTSVDYEPDYYADDDIVTAYIYVDYPEDGREFLECYKEAKQATR